MNKSYVISLLVGFVLVVAFYMITKRPVTEKFANSASTPATTPAATATTTATTTTTTTGTPVLKTLPQSDKVIMYTELFDPSKILSGTTWTADIPSDGSKNFSINAPSGSVNMKGGLVMNGTTLVGPSSDLFTSNTDFSLSPFSVSFYGKLNNLDSITPTNRIVLWTMYAEARPQVPNIVEIAIEDIAAPSPVNGPGAACSTTATKPATVEKFASGPATSVVVRMTIGVDSVKFTIPKSTLLTGQNALYTFTYDTSGPTPVFNFYINKSAPMKYTSSASAQKIYLGNTNMKVNPNTGLSLDMSLMAFIYYGNVLSAGDQISLLDYFDQEANGISQLVKNQQSNQEKLLSEKNALSTSITDLQESLNMCKTKLQATELTTAIKNPWQISLSGNESAAVSAESLAAMYKSCPVNVQNPLTAPAPAAAPASKSSAATPPATTSNVAAVINPTITPANRSPVASGNSSNIVVGQSANDPVFWNTFFKNKQSQYAPQAQQVSSKAPVVNSLPPMLSIAQQPPPAPAPVPAPQAPPPPPEVPSPRRHYRHKQAMPAPIVESLDAILRG
jgi:hypothetical protein